MSSHTEAVPEGRARSGSERQYVSRGNEHGQGQGQYISGHGYAQRYHGSKAWWSVGEFLHQGITHQSVGLSLGHNDEETWDLSDSLADLYQAVTQRQQKAANKSKGHNRSESSGGGLRMDGDRNVDIQRWLDEDTSHGFIRVFTSDADTHARVFPCTLSTSAQKICLQLGVPGNSLHVQLGGDVIRRMEPFDCPLAIQNEYLSGLGFSDIRYVQEEGPKEDLAYLVRFYAGKPLSDYTYSRNQLSTYAYVRKGKLLHQWARRLCVISGTRLRIYREKGAEPTVVQLAKGSVEEVQIKGQSLVLKLTSTLQGERSLYMSFTTQEDYNKWLKKIRKATAKLPSKADLSNCHLEFLPETVFINTELQILILRHNALRERPIEEDIYTIGWLDDLPRFTALRSLNLADNQLNTFPLSLCNIRSLMELNLASNKLEEIPPQISELVNLQVLHLHNNVLSSLPEEIAQMNSLAVIVLAFNQFAHIPTVLLQSQNASFKLDSIIMAGNQISRLPADQLVNMSHIKKIDLRLNRLQLLPTETAKFQSLEHVTHVDIRENQVTDLDIRAIRCMEYLNCERNNMRSMQLNGASLKNVFASHNCLQTLSINPKPEWLVSMDVSYNKLTELPAWLPDCFFLVHLDVSHNHLRSLPERLFTDAQRLKVVKANHNRLTSLPEKIRTDTLEELHLQHNSIRQLSVELFIKAHRLRYLNMTRNKLSDLPPPNKNDSYNKLQELYLSFNHLANRALHKICCFPRLRVLHLSRNKLSVIEETDIEKLEQLTELNVSSNNLTYLPAALGRHPKLQVLRANCNLLQELPNFKNSSGLKVLEVSSNHLVNVNMSNLMASQVCLLDISANPNILVKSHDLEAAKKRLCMVDMRGQNWSLEDIRSQGVIDDEQLWQTGLSQTSGIRNKLSVTAINKPHFSDKGEALFAIFDGGRNDTVSNLLCDIIPSVLREERARTKNPEMYLKYCILSSHRNLKAQGQKLGAAGVVAHLHRDDKGQYILSVANVGDAQVVLCRQRKAYLLSRPFVVADDLEDTKRVVKSGGIITEDGRVAGVSYNTRLLGCSYLYPHIIPEPHVTSTTLTSEDSFFIVASQGLWKYITYEEAIREVKDTPDPVVAAKRLQDLAQGYGSRENIAVLVVRLMLSEEERFRIKDLMRVQRRGQKELLRVLAQPNELLTLRDGVPKVEELTGVVIDKAGHAKKNRGSRKHIMDSDSIGRSHAEEIAEELARMSSSASPQLGENVLFRDELSRKRANPHKQLRREWSDGDAMVPDVDNNDSDGGQHMESRLYRKKMHTGSHSSWENMMKKRLAEEVKAKELKHTFDHSNDNAEEDVSKEVETTNWIAMRQRKKKAEKPEEWEEQLQQRLTQELVDRELRKVVEKNVENDDFDVIEEPNWATKLKKQTAVGLSSDGMLLRNITKPNGDSVDNRTKDSQANNILDGMPSTMSTESIDSDVIRMMSNSLHSHPLMPENFQENSDEQNDSFERTSPNEGYNISPCESVSSIDVRLHNEADEIYRLRYINTQAQNEINEAKTHFSAVNVSKSGFSETDQITQNEIYTRPLSPDSLISQDEFVKPPISNANIDRDALLFHQMQMARAQAHAGSSASLDSIQSAPMHAGQRDVYPNVRASSHSIEVLVNIGEDKPLKHLSDSMRGGRVQWGSSFSGNVSGNSTVTSSRVANVDSDSDRQSMGQEEPLKTYQRKVEVECHAVRHGDKTGAFVIEDNNDDISADDNDNDTLVGDADDLGLIEDDDDDIFVHKSNKDVKKNSHNGHVLTEANVKLHNKDKNVEVDNDSDSDDSIGDVSLGDGYSAVEFHRVDRLGSLSMLNVLESESEDYPELFMTKKNSIKGEKFLTMSGNSNSKQSLVLENDQQTSQKVIVNDEEPVNDDYETIDDFEETVTTQVVVKEINTFVDDLNPYEDVNFLPRSGKIGPRFKPKPDRSNLSSEEDIDALYAKVNKIKMDKIREKHGDNEVMDHNLDTLLPIILPQSDPEKHEKVGRYKSPDQTFTEIESAMNFDSEGGGSEVRMNDEETEIFISATDVRPSNSVKTGSFSQPSTSYSRNMDQVNPQYSMQSTNTMQTFKKPPVNAFGVSASTSPSTPPQSQKSSPLPRQKCNTSNADTSLRNKSPVAFNSSSVSTATKSFKPVLSNTSSAPAAVVPASHRRHPAPPPPPPIPPKLPYPKPSQEAGQSNNVSPRPSLPPPRPPPSQKSSKAPSQPSLANSSPKSTPVQSPRPIPRERLSLTRSDKSSDDSDQSVLSAHELYPDSHQPSSSCYPSSIDVSSPASKLPTQRSIIITYL